MSGTSLDGIDAALVALEEGTPPNILATNYQPYTHALQKEILGLHASKEGELHQTQIISNQLAELYAQCVLQLLSQAQVEATQIKAVGSHGQTIRHCPKQGYTVQLGNAALLSELLSITVVSDFRSRDIAASGQGAPLVPAFHDRVLRHHNIHRVIVNIGGISNLTNLPPGKSTTGFDCGPGNLLMDAWCLHHTGKAYDQAGAWATTGQLLPDLLDKLLREPFISQPPPKSTGRDLFSIAWLQNQLSGGEKPENVQATLLELTCQTIAQAINEHCKGAQEIYVCGGGAHNHALLNRLEALTLNCTIQTTDTLGLSGDFMEATAFAWLAQQALHGVPANLPLVTGAKHPCILGAIYQHANY